MAYALPTDLSNDLNTMVTRAQGGDEGLQFFLALEADDLHPFAAREAFHLIEREDEQAAIVGKGGDVVHAGDADLVQRR